MRRKRNNFFTISDFICEECGKNFPLPRKTNQCREKGHIKTFYCPYCKKKTNHLEERDCDYYTGS